MGESWGSGRIIALFVVFPLALIGFVVVQWWLGENATSKFRFQLCRFGIGLDVNISISSSPCRASADDLVLQSFYLLSVFWLLYSDLLPPSLLPSRDGQNSA